MDLSIDPRTMLSATNTKSQATDPKEKELLALRRSCREFEAIYINEMYKAMRKTVPDSGLFEKDMSSELYKEMLDMELAKQTAAGKGMGVGEAMYDQLKEQISSKSKNKSE
ncbi:MAG: rod-binding protein [Proteobacteria bacterium]|nr:rod-binding protein [Pseudomonadota bacterium]MBU1416931.1 rod-binding protein [Pseudomonadota bacterium]MBU1456696.1 rod-binding protein [Pseudomonadota bacterium]